MVCGWVIKSGRANFTCGPCTIDVISEKNKMFRNEARVVFFIIIYSSTTSYVSETAAVEEEAAINRYPRYMIPRCNRYYGYNENNPLCV